MCIVNSLEANYKTSGSKKEKTKITIKQKQNKKAVHIIIIAVQIRIIPLNVSKLSLRGGKVKYMHYNGYN
jgi:hypothetical protein